MADGDSLRTVTLRVTPWSDLGVSRDIEIQLDQTLHELHSAIQKAFELDNEHLYAFYMNGNAFDRQYGYEGSPSDARPSARDTTLGQFSLLRNKRFLYLFDFGDELRHDVKVVSYGDVDEGATYPRIIASVGRAPPQYDEWPIDDKNSNEAGTGEHDADCCYGHESSVALAEPERQRIAELIPRIEYAIECYEHRSWGDDTEPRTGTDLADEYHLARTLFEVTKGDPTTMHIGVEHVVKGPLWAWLCDLPVELSSASMHDEALDLAEHVQGCLGTVLRPFLGVTDTLRIRMPWFLLRANREEDARATLAVNLLEFPQNPRVELAAAELELTVGNPGQAESHYREALEWVGTERRLRSRIVAGLKELLQNAGQTEAVQTLLQQEEDFMVSVFSRQRAQSPVRRQVPKVGRNDPCPCGSGKKSKKCCGGAN